MHTAPRKHLLPHRHTGSNVEERSCTADRRGMRTAFRTVEKPPRAT